MASPFACPLARMERTLAEAQARAEAAIRDTQVAVDQTNAHLAARGGLSIPDSIDGARASDR